MLLYQVHYPPVFASLSRLTVIFSSLADTSLSMVARLIEPKCLLEVLCRRPVWDDLGGGCRFLPESGLACGSSSAGSHGLRPRWSLRLLLTRGIWPPGLGRRLSANTYARALCEGLVASRNDLSGCLSVRERPRLWRVTKSETLPPPTLIFSLIMAVSTSSFSLSSLFSWGGGCSSGSSISIETLGQ